MFACFLCLCVHVSVFFLQALAAPPLSLLAFFCERCCRFDSESAVELVYNGDEAVKANSLYYANAVEIQKHDDLDRGMAHGLETMDVKEIEALRIQTLKLEDSDTEVEVHIWVLSWTLSFSQPLTRSKARSGSPQAIPISTAVCSFLGT